MYRFFVEPSQVEEHVIRIHGTDMNHIKNVLRMKIGEEILISTGEKTEYTCYIEAYEEEEVLAHIMYAQEAGYELASRIYLFQGLPKSDKMELIIQKAVELGAAQVVPVAMKRSVVKLDAKKEKTKLARWQALAESAAKQSKRSLIPEVTGVKTLPEALELAKELDVFLVPYESAEGIRKTRAVLAGLQPGQSIGVLIGPEGGFEPAEAQAAEETGGTIISLGKRILRTETAGISLLGTLMLQLEQDEGCTEESGAKDRS